MKTITIQIGNSDDKLTQKEWANFWEQADREIRLACWEIHFRGYPSPVNQYQNACWVIEIKNENVFSLKQELRSIAHTFKQDSIAWIEGTTEFI